MKFYGARSGDAGEGARLGCRAAVPAAKVALHAMALARRTHAPRDILRRHAGDRDHSTPEAMEDILMMQAYGIPCGVYWIDRPWGPGHPWGYDDFEIDEKRLPNFGKMIEWLGSMETKMVLWIGPFYQGQMATNAWSVAGISPGRCAWKNGNNYPMVDFSNPEAKAYWQSGGKIAQSSVSPA